MAVLRSHKLLGAGLAGILSLPAFGQSIAEAARREKERRAQHASPAPPKVYTDTDLASHGESPEAQPSPSADASPAATTSSDDATRKALDAESNKRKLLQAEWRVRFASARRRISEAEARCWHRVVETVFVSGIPVQQWVDKFEESEELRQRKHELEDLEEEYRRTGLPPGWVRE